MGPSRTLDPRKGHQDQLHLPLAASSGSGEGPTARCDPRWPGPVLHPASHTSSSSPTGLQAGENPSPREGAGGWPRPAPSACALLPAEFPGPAGGSLHGAHGRRPQRALLQRVEPIDSGAAGRAHVSPQLSRVLPLLQKHLGRALGKVALG